MDATVWVVDSFLFETPHIRKKSTIIFARLVLLACLTENSDECRPEDNVDNDTNVLNKHSVIKNLNDTNVLVKKNLNW